MLIENSTAKGLNAQTYRLGKTLGVGGEGTVYEISGTDLVAKIYRQADPEQERKLKYMAWHPVSNVVDQHGNRIMTLAWPKDVLYDGSGSFAGYIMPRVEGGIEIFEIERGCTGAAAKAAFPTYTWQLNVLVARNLAAAVMALHRQNYVIGDMNCKNIMVNSDGSIIMLDTDSCDVTDQATGRHYKCCVGTEEYLPPELQGVDLRSPRANFTAQTDDFALAVHIFRLLMDNRHPFTCRQLVQPQNSNHQNQLLQNVAQGKCPYIQQIPDFGIPLGAPTLEEIVPDYIQQDFIGTFHYTESTALSHISSRTTAAQWVQDLKRLLQECDTGLIQCNQNPAHFYLRSIGTCGMCAARKRLDDSMDVNPQELFDRAWAYDQQGNMAAAIPLYRQAAERGNACAQNQLGICYGNGKGVLLDSSEAVRWYRMAANQGDAEGQFNLAWCLSTGTGVAQNHTEAVRLYRMAAEQGHAGAQCNLGSYLFNGTDVPKNISKAVTLFQNSADQGNMYAQNWLGYCYETGQGVPQSYTEAVKWYRMAAEQGHACAKTNLGLCLLNGNGVPQNAGEAVTWFRKSAEQGDVAGRFNLAWCLSTGTGVAQNHSEAVRWYRMAAEQGDAGSQCNLGSYLFNGTDVPKNISEAVTLFQNSADQGNMYAQNWLGYCYETGQGVPQSYTEAVKWYRMAAEQGLASAQNNLSCKYEYGQGVEKNLAQAVYWCQQAAEREDKGALERLPQLETQLKQAPHPVEIDDRPNPTPMVVQMEADASILYIDPSICVSCGVCQGECPTEAIAEGIHGFEIDSNICVECGMCEDHCPVNAVRRGSSSDAKQAAARAAKPVPEKKGLGSFFKKMRDRH